ncbi:unnamed protein product [Dovyalis caffra]|uniref:Uncharacterized protein n=1 Tax=Dovyalis caffra TaxID=77055 RepID=A0AAV1RUX1_9ROSI|nr:unnamed protein product [Dovyalis caffra]
MLKISLRNPTKDLHSCVFISRGTGVAVRISSLMEAKDEEKTASTIAGMMKVMLGGDERRAIRRGLSDVKELWVISCHGIAV